MLDACTEINTNPSEKELLSLRDACPFQDHDNPSMINARVGAGEVSEPNAGIFGVARPQCTYSSLDLKYVVIHDALGKTSLRRVDTFNGVSPYTRTHGRSEHLAITITQGQWPKRFWRTDEEPLCVDFAVFGNKYCSACSKANGQGRPPVVWLGMPQ